MNAQTANRLADHLAQQMIKPDPNSALSKALQKHAAPTKLSEIGIEAKNKPLIALTTAPHITITIMGMGMGMGRIKRFKPENRSEAIHWIQAPVL